MFRIVPAVQADVPLILQFIRDLAAYERMEERVTATEETLRSTLFGPNASAHAVIAYDGEEPVAFAVYFFNYSTFSASRGLYLEDILVRPTHRRSGVGRRLFSYLAQKALDHGCDRLELLVLNWNKSAIQFYEKLGAKPLDQWTVFRLSETNLRQLAIEATEDFIGFSVRECGRKRRAWGVSPRNCEHTLKERAMRAVDTETAVARFRGLTLFHCARPWGLRPERFRKSCEVSAYIGMVPKELDSGETERHGRITRHGSRLVRSLLVEVAWAGLRHNPWVRETYQRISGGKKARKKIAIVAVGRQLLVRCWAMLRDNSPWHWQPTIA